MTTLVTVLEEHERDDGRGKRVLVQINEEEAIGTPALAGKAWHDVPRGESIHDVLFKAYGGGIELHTPESFLAKTEDLLFRQSLTTPRRSSGKSVEPGPAVVQKPTQPAKQYLKRLVVDGFRGFGGPAELLLAVPDGSTVGSGLTIVVGTNNSGKSSLLEVLFLLSKVGQTHELTSETRNRASFEHVRLSYEFESGASVDLVTEQDGGSRMTWVWHSRESNPPESYAVYGVPSRRPPVNVNIADPVERHEFQRIANGEFRNFTWQNFGQRLARAHRNRVNFDRVVSQITGKPHRWVLEPSVQFQGTSTPRYESPSSAPHGAESLGDGYWRAQQLADAIYDARDDELILIDEPELSMHPAAQRRLASLLGEAARTRQIVLATHSTAFIEWSWMLSGARLARAFRAGSSIRIANLPVDVATSLENLVGARGNFHTLGTDAKESFFQDDPLILVEGQEDVWGYRRIAAQLGVQMPGALFGWGAGGAATMGTICTLLSGLGYQRVVGVLDGDEGATAESLQSKFPSYKFLVSPMDDVRDKPDPKPKQGFLDSRGQLHEGQQKAARGLFESIAVAVGTDLKLIERL